jgi:hypothetical protein
MTTKPLELVEALRNPGWALMVADHAADVIEAFHDAAKELSAVSDSIYVKVSAGELALLGAAWRKMDAAIAKAEGRELTASERLRAAAARMGMEHSPGPGPMTMKEALAIVDESVKRLQADGRADG